MKRQRKDGTWEFRTMLPDGSVRSFYGKTAAIAKAKMDAARRDFEDGIGREYERMKLSDYLERWLTDTVSDRVRPTTLTAYRSHVATHIKPAIGPVRVRELKPADVDRMLTNMVRSGASPATANRVRATLRSALEALVRTRDLPYNAAKLSTAKTEKTKRVQPLTREQAGHLIEGTRKDAIGPLIEVAIYTGLRQGELLALEWKDIDLEAKTLTVHHTLTWERATDLKAGQKKWTPVFSDPKTEQSKRTIRIPAPALEALKTQRARVLELEQKATVANWKPIPGKDLVFPSAKGGPLNNSNVTNRLKILLENLKLPPQRFHDLRHLTASLLLAEGEDIFTVKEILGHSQITLTANIYGHLSQRLADRAAESLSGAIFDHHSFQENTTVNTTNEITPDDTDGGG